jgi:hypothetical protein
MKLNKFIKRSFIDWDDYSSHLDELHWKDAVETEAKLNIESF